MRMMNKKYTTLIKNFPIYTGSVFITIADPTILFEIRNSKFFVDIFGTESRQFAALCSGSTKNACVHGLFLPNYISHNIIAHEICHLSCRMMKRYNVAIEGEPAAMLTGYLSDLVYKSYADRGISKIVDIEDGFCWKGGVS